MSLRRWKDRMVARLLTRYPGLVKRWAGAKDFSAEMAGWRAGPSFTPWTPLAKPVSECKVALVTTGGVHLRTQAPFDMENPDGDPTFREIPGAAARDVLTITHDYYDHRGADADLNVVFPARAAGRDGGGGGDRRGLAGSSELHGPHRCGTRGAARGGDGACRGAAAARGGGGGRAARARVRAVQPLGRADSERGGTGGHRNRLSEHRAGDNGGALPAPGGVRALAAGASLRTSGKY